MKLTSASLTTGGVPGGGGPAFGDGWAPTVAGLGAVDLQATTVASASMTPIVRELSLRICFTVRSLKFEV